MSRNEHQCNAGHIQLKARVFGVVVPAAKKAWVRHISQKRVLKNSRNLLLPRVHAKGEKDPTNSSHRQEEKRALFVELSIVGLVYMVAAPRQQEIVFFDRWKERINLKRSSFFANY